MILKNKMHLRVFLLLSMAAHGVVVSSIDRQISATSILNYWNNVTENVAIQTDYYKDIVLVLGLTGTGKSTIASVLTNVDLIIEKNKATGQLLISDNNKRIQDDVTIASKTIVPEIMFDNETNTAYVDCPGFMDSRGIEYDITDAYFLQKLLTAAQNIKLLFLTDMVSVQTAGNLNRFTDLLKHSTTLIKQIEKYRNGIGLVVTKVPNEYDFENDRPFDDGIYINRIVSFLSKLKTGWVKQLNETEPLLAMEVDFTKNAIKFVEILLEQKGNAYHRIRIFRNAKRAGFVKSMTDIQNQRKAISKMVNENLHYVPKNDNDFGLPMSSDTKNRIQILWNEMNMILRSDVTDLAKEIKQFYIELEMAKGDLDLLRNKASISLEKFSEIKFSTPLSFLRKIIVTTNTLYDSSMANINLKSFSNDIMSDNFFNVLNTVSDNSWSRDLFSIEKHFITAVDYLVNSQKWYSYLKDLHEILTETSSFDSNVEMKALEVINNCQADKQWENVNSIGLELFVRGIKHRLDNDVQNMILNTFKMKALRQVLHKDVVDKETCECSSNKLLITGFKIKISRASQVTCWNVVNFIEIFAQDKVIVDADIIKLGNVQLSIIAPKWEIVGIRKIVLNGMNGKSPRMSKASNGNKVQKNGANGENGENGGPGGFFLGIGQEFMNDSHLTISTDGGNGGNGQHGGDGLVGSNGESPPVFDTSENELLTDWDNRGFKYSKNKTETRGFIDIPYYTVAGTKAIASGNGGNGGGAGAGGNVGEIVLIGLKQTPKFTTSRNQGHGGIPGKGGKAANEVKDGDTYYVKFDFILRRHGYLVNRVEKISHESGTTHKADANGSDGQVMANNNLKFNYHNPSYTVNSYKHYVLKNKNGNIVEENLDHFVKDLNKNEHIHRLYDTIGLINEFQTLEKPYFRLKNGHSFIPYFQSLLHRITEYNKTVSITNDDRLVLGMLYTATMSRILAFNRNQRTVLNLIGFLRLVKNETTKLDTISSQVNVMTYRNEYKDAFLKKIKSAKILLDVHVMPEIDDIFDTIDSQIVELVDEVIAAQNSKRHEMANVKQKQRELKFSLVMRKMLFPLKIMSSSLLFLGPAATALSSVIGGVAIDDMTADNIRPMQPLNPAFAKMVSKIGDEYKNKFQMLKYQFEHVNKMVEPYMNEGPTWEKCFDKMAKLKIEIDKEMLNINGITPKSINSANRVTELRDEMKEAFDSVKDELKKTEEKKNDERISIVNKALSVIGAFEMAADSFNRIKMDEKKLKLISDTIVTAENDLNVIEAHKENIYNIMVPRLNEVKDAINQMSENLDGKTHVELDIKKWQIQSIIRDTKLLVAKMSEGFEIHEDIKRCIDKLDEGMEITIDIFNRIDSYLDEEKRSTFISNIALSQSSALFKMRPQMNEAIATLHEMIQTNIVIERYNIAVNAFRQHLFPFAQEHLVDFEIVDESSTANITFLVKKVAEQMDKMITEIETSKTTYETYKNDIIIDDKTRFYTWTHNYFQRPIDDMLNGTSVMLQADVKNVLNRSAMKFNRIELVFESINKTLENELNAILRNFSMTMKMIGHNYYRCGKQIYSMSVDDQIEFFYSYEKHSNGKPVRRNRHYDEIQTNDIFLSPYTMWVFELSTENRNDFQKLTAFRNQSVDLVLFGRGQYLKRGSITTQICNKNLDRYYNHVMDSFL